MKAVANVSKVAKETTQIFKKADKTKPATNIKNYIGMTCYPQHLTETTLSLSSSLPKNILQQDTELIQKPHWSTKTDTIYIPVYGKRESIAYASIKMQSTFSAVLNVVSNNDIDMTSILDFGCGTGSAMWACLESRSGDLGTSDSNESKDEIAKKSKIELVTGVDSSNEMIETAMKYCKSYPTTKFEFARFIPKDAKFTFGIISFLLSELEETQRDGIVDLVWSRCDTLLLIDRGTPDSSRSIAKIRERLLTKDAHVVAPCTHDLKCPIGLNSWCHFNQRFQRPKHMMDLKKSKSNLEDIKFSYLLIRKGKRVVDELNKRRLIAPPLKNNGHVIFDVCSNNGELERFVVSRSNGDYKGARKSHWHDIWLDDIKTTIVNKSAK